MNIQETAAVLAKIKLGDNREVNELVIREWHDGISDLDLVDTIEAVRLHRRESTEYLQVAHVRANARRVRDWRERDDRIRRQREGLTAIESDAVPFDREKFDAETHAAIEYHRKKPCSQHQRGVKSNPTKGSIPTRR
jgi:hypothetical protein